MSAPGPRLRDIHLPQVSWWPPAPGWWILAALLSLAGVAGIVLWLRHRQRKLPRMAARRALDALAREYDRNHDDTALAAGLSRLLRRIALLIEPAASANEGAAWRAFLARAGGRAFTDEQLDALIEAPFRPCVSLDALSLLGAARRWCEQALERRHGMQRRNVMHREVARSRNRSHLHAGAAGESP